MNNPRELLKKVIELQIFTFSGLTRCYACSGPYAEKGEPTKHASDCWVPQLQALIDSMDKPVGDEIEHLARTMSDSLYECCHIQAALLILRDRLALTAPPAPPAIITMEWVRAQMIEGESLYVPAYEDGWNRAMKKVAARLEETREDPLAGSALQTPNPQKEEPVSVPSCVNASEDHAISGDELKFLLWKHNVLNPLVAKLREEGQEPTAQAPAGEKKCVVCGRPARGACSVHGVFVCAMNSCPCPLCAPAAVDGDGVVILAALEWYKKGLWVSPYGIDAVIARYRQRMVQPAEGDAELGKYADELGTAIGLNGPDSETWAEDRTAIIRCLTLLRDRLAAPPPASTPAAEGDDAVILEALSFYARTEPSRFDRQRIEETTLRYRQRMAQPAPDWGKVREELYQIEFVAAYIRDETSQSPVATELFRRVETLRGEIPAEGQAQG